MSNVMLMLMTIEAHRRQKPIERVVSQQNSTQMNRRYHQKKAFEQDHSVFVLHKFE
jgi:hypothetical protein